MAEIIEGNAVKTTKVLQAQKPPAWLNAKAGIGSKKTNPLDRLNDLAPTGLGGGNAPVPNFNTPDTITQGQADYGNTLREKAMQYAGRGAQAIPAYLANYLNLFKKTEGIGTPTGLGGGNAPVPNFNTPGTLTQGQADYSKTGGVPAFLKALGAGIQEIRRNPVYPSPRTMSPWMPPPLVDHTVPITGAPTTPESTIGQTWNGDQSTVGFDPLQIFPNSQTHPYPIQYLKNPAPAPTPAGDGGGFGTQYRGWGGGGGGGGYGGGYDNGYIPNWLMGLYQLNYKG